MTTTLDLAHQALRWHKALLLHTEQIPRSAAPWRDSAALPANGRIVFKTSFETPPQGRRLLPNELFDLCSPPYQGGVRGGYAMAHQQPPPGPLLGKEGVIAQHARAARVGVSGETLISGIV